LSQDSKEVPPARRRLAETAGPRPKRSSANRPTSGFGRLDYSAAASRPIRSSPPACRTTTTAPREGGRQCTATEASRHTCMVGATEARGQVSRGSRRGDSRPATAEQNQDQHGRAGKHQGQAQRGAAAELGEQSGKERRRDR